MFVFDFVTFDNFSKSTVGSINLVIFDNNVYTMVLYIYSLVFINNFSYDMLWNLSFINFDKLFFRYKITAYFVTYSIFSLNQARMVSYL